MKITVHVKPNSRKNEVLTAADGTILVRVSAPPADGQANVRVIELLARRFGIPKSRVHILRGMTSRKKIIEIV